MKFMPALMRLARAYTPESAPAAFLNPGQGVRVGLGLGLGVCVWAWVWVGA